MPAESAPVTAAPDRLSPTPNRPRWARSVCARAQLVGSGSSAHRPPLGGAGSALYGRVGPNERFCPFLASPYRSYRNSEFDLRDCLSSSGPLNRMESSVYTRSHDRSTRNFGDLTSNVRVVLEGRESGHSAHPNAPQEGCLGAGMMGGDGWGVGTAMPSFEAYLPFMGGPTRHTRHTRRLLREGKPSSSEAGVSGVSGGSLSSRCAALHRAAL